MCVWSTLYMCAFTCLMCCCPKEIVLVVEAGSLTKEVRRISGAVRLTVALRRCLAARDVAAFLAARDVAAFLAVALAPSNEAFTRVSPLPPKIRKHSATKPTTTNKTCVYWPSMVTLGVAACVSGKFCFSDKSTTRSTRATRLGWILCPANPSCLNRRLVAAAAAPVIEAPPRSIDRECAPVPREQVEVVRSLNGWVAENMLPLLNPVESSWQPHDFLPCSAGASEDEALWAFTEGVRELRAGAAGVPDEVLVCLVGNMVTEEALPSYQSMGNRTEGIADETGESGLPWARWMRGWAAEENRHGDLLNRYLYLSGRVDMRQVEATIHHLLRNGMGMLVPKSPYHSVIYGAFQERATFVSHGHTGRLARQHGDGTLARICGVIAADEKRHEAGYTRVSARLFELDPDGMVRALACVMRGKVTMPGLLMSDGAHDDDAAGGGSLFARFSAVAQRAGVYTARDYGDLVEHFVRRWRVAELDRGLSGEGRAAQEYLCGLPSRIRRMEDLAQRRAARSELKPVRFSWIFGRRVMVG